MDIGDLLATYPVIEAPSFPNAQTFIANKHEFNELRSTPTERIQKRGKLFRQQELLKRYMRIYDRILIMWRTGTGKTCGFAAITEYFKNNEPRFKKFIVITKSETLINDFKKQLVCKCTDGEYEVSVRGDTRDPSVRKAAVTTAVNQYYRLTTYTTFGEEVRRVIEQDPSLNLLRERYSDVIIFLDEVQELRLDEVKDNREDVPDTEARQKARTYEALFILFHNILRSKIVLASATPMVNSVDEIAGVMNLILPSAGSDPQVEQTLPFRSWQLPTGYDYSNVSIEQMQPYFKGRVSYVRELDTGAVAVEMGNKLEVEYMSGGRTLNGQMTIFASDMSPFQTEVFLRVQEGGLDRKKTAFLSNQAQANNFVFPNGTYGTEGFNEYLEVENPRDEVCIIKPEYEDIMKTALFIDDLENGLYKHSCKYAQIVSDCINAKGICFVYSSLVRGSGLIILGKALERNGFDRYLETTSQFENVNTETEGYCSGGKGDSVINKDFSKSPRYLLYAGGDSVMKASGLELINSYENRYGEYIKVVLVSPSGQQGISFNNVVSGHIVGSEWNETAVYQAISRIFRSTSHIDLLDEQAYCLERDGKDPALATVPVKVFKHAAIPLPELIDKQKAATIPGYGLSLDIQRYQLAERKDIPIKTMQNYIKRCSIDCFIHRARNIRETDVDGSALCDYLACNYQCFDPPPKPGDEDFSTYDILYSSEIVDRLVEKLISLYKTRFTYKYSELYDILVPDSVNPDEVKRELKYVDMAIDKVISTRKILFDRYGLPTYLKDGGGAVYLAGQLTEDGSRISEGEIKIGAGYALRNYTSTFIGIKSSTLSNWLDNLQKTSIVPTFDLIKKSTSEDQTKNILTGLYTGGRAQILEETTDILLENPVFQQLGFPLYQIAEYANTEYAKIGAPKVADPWQVYVLKYFEQNIFAANEPVDEINRIAASVRHESGERGRPIEPEPSRFKRASKRPVVVSEGAEIVFIHNVYSYKQFNTAYSDMVRLSKAEGRIRVYKPSEGVGWRDLTQFEIIPYNAVAQKHDEDLTNEFSSKFTIYGVQIGNVFRIVDKETEQVGAKNNDRMKNRGKKCAVSKKDDDKGQPGDSGSWNLYDLVDLMYRLGIPAPINNIIEPQIKPLYKQDGNLETAQEYKERLFSALIKYLNAGGRSIFEKMGFTNRVNDTIPYAEYFYRWYSSGTTNNRRVNVCNKIKQFFVDTGRLYVRNVGQ